MQCPDCGTLNARADRMCRMCGRVLPTPPQSEPAPSPTATGAAPPPPAEEPGAEPFPPSPPRSGPAGRRRSSPPRCPSCFALNVFDATFCRSCGTRLPEESFELPGSTVESSERSGPEWESANGYFDLRALFATMRSALLAPNVTFSNMRREGGVVRPLMYVLVVHLVFLPVYILMFWLAGSEIRQMAHTWGQQSSQVSPDPMNEAQLQAFADAMAQSQRGEISPEELERRLSQARDAASPTSGGTLPRSAPATALARVVEFALGPVGLMIGVPLLLFGSALFSLFFGTLVIHGGLLLVGAAHSLETTFRALCYSSGSAAPLQLVPGVGQSLGSLWALVISILAQARAHETTAWRVLGGYLLLFGLLIAGMCSLARF